MIVLSVGFFALQLTMSGDHRSRLTKLVSTFTSTGSCFALLVLVMKYEQEFTGTNHVIAFYASN